MRSVERSSSGGAAGGGGRRARAKAEQCTAGSAARVGGGAGGVCGLGSNAARVSGAVAFGKEANGQPSQAGAVFTSTTPNGEAAAETSCPQMAAQAAHSHRVATGSNTAVSLFSGKRLTGILRIIPGAVVACHPGKRKPQRCSRSRGDPGSVLRIFTQPPSPAQLLQVDVADACAGERAGQLVPVEMGYLFKPGSFLMSTSVSTPCAFSSPTNSSMPRFEWPTV